MLQELNLRNFKKHKDLSLSLAGGLTSITGNNAAGKSTVLKAILFALFGASAAGAKDHLWSWGSKEKRQVALRLTLPEHGDVVITRTPSGASVVDMHGKTLASGNAAVTKLIEESLGMLAKDIRTLCYSPQGEAQGLLNMGPAVLQQKVEGLARVDVLDKVLGRVAQDITKLDGRLEGIPVDLDIEGLTGRIQILQAKKEEQEQNLSVSSQLREQEGEKAAECAKTLDAARKTEQQRDSLHKEMVRLQVRQGQVQDNLAQLDLRRPRLPSNAEQQKAALTTQYHELKAQYDAAVSKLAQAEAVEKQRQQLQADIARLTGIVAGHTLIEQDIQALNTRLRDERAVLAKYLDELSAAEENRRRFTTTLHDARCPTCKRDFDGFNFEEIEAEAADWSRIVAELSIEVSARRADVANTEKRLQHENGRLEPKSVAALEFATNALAEISADEAGDSGALRQHVAVVAKEVNDLVEIIKEISGDIAKATEIDRQSKDLEDERQTITQQLEAVQQRFLDLPANDLASIEMRSAALLDGLKRLDQQVSDYRQAAAHIAQEIRFSEAELEKVKALALQRQELEKEQAHLGQFQKFLRGNRSRWAADIWDGLLSYASALISSTSSGILSGLSRSEKGEFTVEEAGRVIPVEEASGFQKSLIGTALRVALSKVFYGDNLFLLLDEATSDANDENAAAVAGMLASLNMQIVFVSHRGGDAVNAESIVSLK